MQQGSLWRCHSCEGAASAPAKEEKRLHSSQCPAQGARSRGTGYRGTDSVGHMGLLVGQIGVQKGLVGGTD